MREGLRKVAEKQTGDRVHLLTEESQRRTLLQQRLEQGGGFLVLAGIGQGLHKPEGTGQERPLRPWEAILTRRIPVEQREACGQFPADGIDSPRQAGRIRLFQARERKDQQGCVNVPGTVSAGVRIHGFVVAVRAEFRRDPGAFSFPAEPAPRAEPVGSRDAQGTVQREPGHDFGMHMLRGVTAHFPDAGVGLLPGDGDQIREAAHGPPRFRRQPAAALHERPGGVNDPAVAVKLVL
jgi:hypothetical protein